MMIKDVPGYIKKELSHSISPVIESTDTDFLLVVSIAEDYCIVMATHKLSMP